MLARGMALVFTALAPCALAADDLRFEDSFPEAPDHTVAMSTGVMMLGLPDVSANALAVDSESGPIDLSPDLNAAGPVLGFSFGKAIDLPGRPSRLVGSAFYGSMFGGSEVAVSPGYGAFGWLGNRTGMTAAYATTDLASGPPPHTGVEAGAFGIDDTASLELEVPIPDPVYAAALAIAQSDLGSAYVFAGQTAGLADFGLGPLDIGISYARTAAYYLGELALEHDLAADGVALRTGPVYRGLDLDLDTTLNVATWLTVDLPDDGPMPVLLGGSTTLSETLEADYTGWLLGATLSRPLGGGATLDLGLSGAPMYLNAQYSGYEDHTFRLIEGGVAEISTSALTDREHRLAGLIRARAAVRTPLVGNVTFELAGEVEYLSAVPTIARTFVGSVAADSVDASSSVGDCCSLPTTPLAALAFDDMLALSLHGRLVLPIGAQ